MTQHIHILGIAGTYMASLALLTKSAGYHVTGYDKAIYPPMSDQLAQKNITVSDEIEVNADIVVIGNAMRREHPAVEFAMTQRIPIMSGPQWLNVLLPRTCRIISISGTHGKTTTTALMSWVLFEAKLNPGFLVGGIPENFQHSAELGSGQYFVLEADEYDTAFFDKRPKFMHVFPDYWVINNLEFDHADIYDNLEAVIQQFQYASRLVRPGGKIIIDNSCPNTQQVLQSVKKVPCLSTGLQSGDYQANLKTPAGDKFSVSYQGALLGEIQWSMIGHYNVKNALKVIGIAHQLGIDFSTVQHAFKTFKGVTRRCQVRANINNITFIDDFAHHPTAIALAYEALKQYYTNARVVVLLELGTRTFEAGHHAKVLQDILKTMPVVGLYYPPERQYGYHFEFDAHQQYCISQNQDELAQWVSGQLKPNDVVVVMSNARLRHIQNQLINIQKEKMASNQITA